MLILSDIVLLLAVVECTEWVYDPTTDTTYTLCYDEEEKGNYIATIDLDTFEVQYIGSEPLISKPFVVRNQTSIRQ